MSQVVIGEAVVLDLQPARLPSRALAFAVDALIIGVLLVGILVAISAIGADFDDALDAAISIAVIVGVLVGYPLLWETLTRGRSPGKYAMGLRVVRDDGGPIRFRHALVRALTGVLLDFGVVSSGTGFIAVIVSLCSSRGKRVGDLLAGTVVLRERVPHAHHRDLPDVHPGLAAWATSLELSGVPDDLALVARQFLVRAPQLEPAVRASMAERLAGDVATRVAPPPPPGLPAEAYLAAVLGERRRRETERLSRARPAGAAPGHANGGAPTAGWSPQGPTQHAPTPHLPQGPTQYAPTSHPAQAQYAPPRYDPAPVRPPAGSPADPAGSGFAPPG